MKSPERHLQNKEDSMRKRRKFFAVLAAFLLTVGVTTPAAYAHPPQDVQLAYNIKAQTLTVTITHKTPFAFHYINSVVIKKNGMTISTNNYDKQPDPATFSYTYQIPAGAGDAFEVTANCSLSGNKTASLDVK